MRVYYAHCQAIYNTPQEQRDIDLLKQLGFEVLNPNKPNHVRMAKEMRERGENVMLYFEGLVDQCDVLAFRSLPDGRIPAGIAKEIKRARDCTKPVFELPSSILRRSIGVEETREYLTEMGQRSITHS